MPREAGGREGPNARLIRAFARRHPERVRALDWIAYARGRSGWFASDDLHLTRPGGRGMGRLIARVPGSHAVRARMVGSGEAVSVAGRTLPLGLVGIELPPPDACGGPQARDLLLRLAFTLALLEAGLARLHGRGFRGHDRFEAAAPRARAARRGIWACGL